MRFLRASLLPGLFIVLALVISACGGSSTTKVTPLKITPSRSLPIKTASVQVGSMTKTILVDGKGNTLYYRAVDTATSVYQGATWPALLAPSSTATPTGPDDLTGTLAVDNDANGPQVTYNGHPLYIYSGDKNTPGKTTGDGLGSIWYVATPDLPLLY